jgi:hypothetical protein
MEAFYGSHLSEAHFLCSVIKQLCRFLLYLNLSDASDRLLGLRRGSAACYISLALCFPESRWLFVSRVGY